MDTPRHSEHSESDISHADAPDADAPDAAVQEDLLRERLDDLLPRLKEARKVLARDWDTLTPRERSHHSRAVKELETEKQALLDSLQMT